MANSRPSGEPEEQVVATLLTLNRIGTRHKFLSEEIAETDEQLAQIISAHAAGLLAVKAWVSRSRPSCACSLHRPCRGRACPGILRENEPPQALPRRRQQANASLYGIVLGCTAKDSGAREYVARCTEDSLSKKVIIRCLGRYVVREIFRVMKNPRPTPLVKDLRPLRLSSGSHPGGSSQRLGLLDHRYFTDRERRMP